MLEEWQLLRQAQVASVPVEIELWHRTDAARQAAAENAIVSMVQAAGGRVVTSTAIPIIDLGQARPAPKLDAIEVEEPPSVALA